MRKNQNPTFEEVVIDRARDPKAWPEISDEDMVALLKESDKK